jgi:hypothetical protein
MLFYFIHIFQATFFPTHATFFSFFNYIRYFSSNFKLKKKKAFLRESNDAASPHASDLIDIPQLHGPAVECLGTALKTMATELNSFEKGTTSAPLGPSPTLTILRSALHAVLALEHASRKRLSFTRKGIRPWTPPVSPNAFTLSNWELMSECERSIISLQNSLIAETDSAMASIQAAMAEASKKAAEANSGGNGGDGELSPEVKARMEAVAEKERQLKAKMSPDELAKYEKKKAEKDAKAAAKASAKKDKSEGGGGGGNLKSAGFKLSPGIETVVNMFRG